MDKLAAPLTAGTMSVVCFTRALLLELGRELPNDAPLLFVLVPGEEDAGRGCEPMHVIMKSMQVAPGFVESISPRTLAVMAANGEDAKTLRRTLLSGSQAVH